MTNKEAIENIKWYRDNCDGDFPSSILQAFDIAIKAIEETGNIRPKGKWIEERDRRGHLITRKCPICKAYHDGMIINFCPYCGADMRGDV